MSWFNDTPETRRLFAEEELLLAATELVAQAIEERGITRQELARRLDVRPSEITQRLAGARNLTLRTFASMMDALGFKVLLGKCERDAQPGPARAMSLQMQEDQTYQPNVRYTSTGARIQLVREAC
ncbi:helix-turn-helix transcriptional regulator [Microbispora sp. H11081]|uniref:helix-turn-helix domain-containing protein n=1 Tax=Microbispora sp. H11081 TaxID=2729107 RepID=UPI001474660B|nr:helix-turn-helix transcriptional regulator [Microbispora sp. H11081]